MTRKRKAIWIGTILLVLAGGAGGYWWYWQSHAIDRKVCQLVYEAAGYPDTKFEKRLRSMKLDFLIREKPKPRMTNAISAKPVRIGIDYCSIHEDILAIGPNAIPELITLLEDENDNVRGEAAWSLGLFLDSSAVDPLINKLEKEKSDKARSRIVNALGDIGDNKAVQPLVYVLQNDQDRLVRFCSAFALGKLGDSRAVEPLIKSVETDENPDVREAAITALGKIHDKKAVVPLMQYLQKETNTVIRMRTIESLGDLEDPRAKDILEKIMQDNKAIYGYHCSVALAKINNATKQPGQTATLPAETQPAGGQ